MTAASEAVVRAPNSVVLIGDPAGEVPQSMTGTLVSATSSCVAVGTLSDTDGETTIRVVSAARALNPPTQLAFEGEIKTPSNRLTVTSVLDDTYLERVVDGPSVPLEIWVNDLEEPDDICVVVG